LIEREAGVTVIYATAKANSTSGMNRGPFGLREGEQASSSVYSFLGNAQYLQHAAKAGGCSRNIGFIFS